MHSIVLFSAFFHSQFRFPNFGSTNSDNTVSYETVQDRQGKRMEKMGRFFESTTKNTRTYNEHMRFNRKKENWPYG